MIVRTVQERFHAGRRIGQHGGRRRTVFGAIVVAAGTGTAVADGHRPDGPPEVVAESAIDGGGRPAGRGRGPVVFGGCTVAATATAATTATATAATDHVAAAVERYRVGRRPQHAALASTAGGRKCSEQGHMILVAVLLTGRRIKIRRSQSETKAKPKRQYNRNQM